MAGFGVEIGIGVGVGMKQGIKVLTGMWLVVGVGANEHNTSITLEWKLEWE